MPSLDLIVPGPLEQLTGGYIYDRRVLTGLRALGWTTTAHLLDASFPEPTGAALDEATRILDTIADGRTVLIDGLALTGLAPVLRSAGARLELVALIHHPLAMETGLPESKRRALGEAERHALAHTPRVVVTSRWTRSALAEYGVTAERITVIEPGVERADPGAGLPPGAPRASEAGLVQGRRNVGDAVRLLTVGAITPRKGYDVLVRALATISDLDWRSRCAASLERDPATVATVRRLIAEHGLADRIELLGELSPRAVATEYARADLFVLPSRLEGYGMVIAEAVANGLPVVATAAGAIPDTLPKGAGEFVPPDDCTALAATLRALISDRERLASLTDSARAASTSIPTWDETIARFAAALGGKGR